MMLSDPLTVMHHSLKDQFFVFNLVIKINRKKEKRIEMTVKIIG